MPRILCTLTSAIPGDVRVLPAGRIGIQSVGNVLNCWSHGGWTVMGEVEGGGGVDGVMDDEGEEWR